MMTDRKPTPEPQTTLHGDWYEAEFLGNDEVGRYVNLHIDIPEDLHTGVTLKQHSGNRNGPEQFSAEIEFDTESGEVGDTSFQYLLGGDDEADAEAFHELADAARQAAEYLEDD